MHMRICMYILFKYMIYVLKKGETEKRNERVGGWCMRVSR